MTMAVVDVEPKGEFAQELVKLMNEHGLTIREVAEKADVTYESVRRLVHGIAFPSNMMLKTLCPIVGMEYNRAKQLATADKIVQKYGSVAHVLAGKNPELAEIERAWPTLEEGQKQDVIATVLAMARRNRNGGK